MLVILKSRSASAAKDYFDQSLRIGDYYHDGHEVTGRWHGLGAARLGLTGPVTRQAFCALIDGMHPLSGEKLAPRRKADRVPGFDFTFTAPKSVSVLYGLTGDERIVDAFRQSVVDGMREVEREMKTRVRARGRDEDRVTGNMVWGEFLHKTGRPVGGIPDPHLHIHAYAANLTYDGAEKRWKAAQIGDIKGEGLYYEAVFHAALARRLAMLGYGIARDGRFFEVAGLERPLLDRFSQRRDIIEGVAAAKGEASPEAKRALSRLTRERKSESLPFEHLLDVWKARLLPAQRRELDRVVVEARHGLSPHTQANVRELAGLELAEALKGDSATSEKAILTQVLRRGFGSVIAGEARAAIEARDIVRGEVGGRSWLTTLEAYAAETRVVAFARDGRNRCAPLVAGAPAIRTDWLNDQQKAAVRHLWSSQDRVMMLRGGAGVGKTTLMAEAVDGMTRAGQKCFVFASTVPATEVLRADGFKAAQTIQRLLISAEAQNQIGDDAVIWVDEAGLVDMATMDRLFTLAGERNWRVILSGDERQHAPVRRGDAMRLLRQRAHLPLAEVTEIVRQRGDYKQAVQSIEGGLIEDGWRQLEAMGAIIECGGHERIERLAADYLQALETGDSVLVVAPTNREREMVTAVIRSALQREGLLAGEETEVGFLRNLYWTDEAKRDVERYRPGLVVRFRQHAPGISSGETLTIDHVSPARAVIGRDASGRLREIPLGHANRFEVHQPETRRFAVGDRVRCVERCPVGDGGELTKGSFHTVSKITSTGELVLDGNRVVAKHFPFLDHGYSSTSVSAQGLTVNTVLVAMGAASVPAMSKEQFYVSVSRGKRRVRLYVDDVKEVREAVKHSSARPTAHDLIEGRIGVNATRDDRIKAWRRRLSRTAERMVREGGPEVAMDAGLWRQARDEALVEYRGRLKEHAAELGE